jgi:hypothetical protein
MYRINVYLHGNLGLPYLGVGVGKGGISWSGEVEDNSKHHEIGLDWDGVWQRGEVNGQLLALPDRLKLPYLHVGGSCYLLNGANEQLRSIRLP